MIDWKDQERPITLRDGSEALVVGIVDGKLVGVIFSYRASPRDFFTCVWNEDGSYRADRSTSPMDLIQAPKRVEYNGWANLQLLKEDHSEIYDHSSIYVYESENKAIHDAHEGGEHNDAIAIPLTVTIEGDKVTIHGEGKVNKAKE